METMPAPALVATLGLQPQIVTRALDLLLDEIEPELASVYIIHTDVLLTRHPHWQSLNHFGAYLAATYPQLSFDFLPIKSDDGRTVRDVETPDTAELAFKVIFNTVRKLKQAGHPLHGLIAGGRKSMIVYTMISAQLLFDEEDQLWHLFSTLETQDPHVPRGQRDKSYLVEIPILHLAGLMPMVRELILNSSDPTRAARLYRKHESVEQIVRLQRFYQEDCDQVDRKILRLAYKGWGNREIGDAVGLTESPVTNRITNMARRFYRRGYGRPPRPWPKHIKIKLLDDLAPLLRQLEPDG